jgi:hypothetical protein
MEIRHKIIYYSTKSGKLCMLLTLSSHQYEKLDLTLVLVVTLLKWLIKNNLSNDDYNYNIYDNNNNNHKAK